MSNGSIKLAAADGVSPAGHTDEVSDVTIPPSAATAVNIAPQGESYIFGTGLRGHTLFYMINLGPGEAEAIMTWQGQHAPQLVQLQTNRVNGVEFYSHEFAGAKVTLINLSASAVIRLRVTQSA